MRSLIPVAFFVSEVAAGLPLRGAAGSGPDLPPLVRFDRENDRCFTPDDWPQALTADLYLPRTPGLRPAVLVVHGGGWEGGAAQDMHAICRALARRGFVVMNSRYRLAPAHRFPAQLDDVAQALRWLRDQALALRIDAGRIGAFGYSAGAHLVALLAAEDKGSRLAAVVAGGLPADLRRWPNSRLVKGLIGESLAAAPERWSAASPIVHISAQYPPVFLYHGARDRLVEPEQSIDFKGALEAAGVPVDLRLAPGHGHISVFLFDRQSLNGSVAFLARHLMDIPDADKALEAVAP